MTLPCLCVSFLPPSFVCFFVFLFFAASLCFCVRFVCRSATLLRCPLLCFSACFFVGLSVCLSVRFSGAVASFLCLNWFVCVCCFTYLCCSVDRVLFPWVLPSPNSLRMASDPSDSDSDRSDSDRSRGAPRDGPEEPARAEPPREERAVSESSCIAVGEMF